MPVTARCHVSSKILIWPIGLILPGWTQTQAAVPACSAAGWGTPLLPTVLPGPVLCRVLESCWRAEAGGRDGEEEGNGLQRDRRGERGMGTCPGACILWMLILIPSVFTLSYLFRPLMEKRPVLSVWQAGFESLLLPQVGKTRINSGAAGRGNTLAQQAKNWDKASPPGPSAKFAHHFPSCITRYSPQCPRILPMGIRILQGYC